MRQYEDPPVLRMIRPRAPDRPTDLEVADRALENDVDRAVAALDDRLPETPPSEVEDDESVKSDELILEPYLDLGDKTPVTKDSAWQKLIPPALPKKDS